MTTTALVLAVLALLVAIAALARAHGARYAAEEAVAEARRRARNVGEELGAALGVQRSLLAMVAAGETVTREMIEEGLCFRDVDAAQARALIDGGEVRVIDVRNPDETASGIIPGANLMPMDEVEERLAEIPKAGPTLIYCALGSRSAAVCEALSQRGWERLINLEGGIAAWDGPLTRHGS